MHSRKKYYAALANFTVPLAGFGTDIYLPSLPDLATVFQTSNASVKLTITAYVFAMAVAQLFAGPVSDAWGRKKIILVAIITQILAMLAIVYSPDIETFIIARFFHGLSAGFMIVPARAILNDCFKAEELKKMFNYLTISFALAPILAPFVGGFCQQYLSWKAGFYFLLIYAAILFVTISLSLTETLEKKSKLSLKHLIHNYQVILKHRVFLLGSVLVGILYGYTALFNVLGPFIFQSHLHFSPLVYGYIALSVGLAWFLGNLTNRIFFSISTWLKVKLALTLHGLAVVMVLLSACFHRYDAAVILISILMLVFASAIIFPIVLGECLMLFPAMAASSNACLFSITWLGFGTYTVLATLIVVDTLLPLGLAFLGIFLMSFMVVKTWRQALLKTH